MNTVRFELYRAFHSRTFVISLLIGSVICALDLITFYIMVGQNGRYLVQAWIGTDYLFAYNQMFYLLLPVLACLPYGGSLYTDIKTGYDKNICVKTSRLNYAFAKSVSVFLSGFVSVCLPLVMNLFIAAGIYSNYKPERLKGISIPLSDIYLFAEIFDKHPAIYCLVYILIDSLFAGAMALTSLSLTVKVRSSFTAVVTPMILFFMFDVLKETQDFGNWTVTEMLNPRQYMHTYWYQMLIVYLVIFTVNVTVITLISKKRDIL